MTSIGRSFGRYQIVAEVGRGGMSTVFRAYDPNVQREVALKVLPREFMHDPHFRMRFEREARVVAQLEHPAIVPIYDFGEADGQSYFVMRLMSGGSLSDRLKDGHLSLTDAALIIERLAPALDLAHTKGILHRDIKPGNILFDVADSPYLTDFGIAKIVSGYDESRLTGTGGIIGTPAYMSPEQGRGETVDRRSDIYSLGIVLFDMLTGRLPFEADTPIAVMLKHITEPVPNLRDLNPALPPEIESVLERALAKDPQKRFATAGELANALTQLARHSLIDATKPGSSVPPNIRIEPHLSSPTAEYHPPASTKPEPTTGTAQTPSLIHILWSRFVNRINRWAERLFHLNPTPPAETHLPTSQQPKAETLASPIANGMSVEAPTLNPPTNIKKNDRRDGVTLLHLGDNSPDLPRTSQQGTMILRRGMEAILSTKNDALIEDWLNLYATRQLSQKLLESDNNTHLLITGYGSFGGTSLARGITQQMRQNFAESDATRVLVLRFELNVRGRVTLFINEQRAEAIAFQSNEREITAIVQKLVKSDPGLDMPIKAEALANLANEILRLLDDRINNTALMTAIKQVCKPPLQRLVLFFDRIDVPERMQSLIASCLVEHPMVTLISITRRERFDQWPEDLREALREAGFDEPDRWYMRRLWERDLDLTQQLSRLLAQNSPASQPEDQEYLDLLLAHLAFKARGSLAIALRELKGDRGWLRDEKQPVLVVAGKYLGREEIEHNAHVYHLLKHQQSVVLKSFFNQTPDFDRAMIGVYYLMDWIRKNPIFSRDELEQAATSPRIITISDQPRLRKAVIENLLYVLVQAGYLHSSPNESEYQVSWREPVATIKTPEEPHTPTDTEVEPYSSASEQATEPTARSGSSQESQPSGPLRVCVIGGREEAHSRAHALAGQVAFEVIKCGDQLVTTDRHGTDTRIREKLDRYLAATGTKVPTKPITIIATTRAITMTDTAEIKLVSGALAQLDELLDHSDAVVLVGGDDTPDSIFSVENVFHAAHKRHIPVLPIGAAGSATATLWSQINLSLKEHFGERITGMDFGRIGPDQRNIPEIARIAVQLAHQVAS